MRKKFFIFTIVTAILVCLSSVSFAAGIMVKYGSRGEGVRQVQELLISHGYLHGDADGICGSQTVAAIKHYQKDNGLEVDGICGSRTYHLLSGGKEFEVSHKQGAKVVYVEATGYSAMDPGNNPYTASGTLVRHGVIAVDPAFIPIGTRVYIPGYGEAVAEDIGWGIQGNLIDVAFDTHEEALAFGRQDLEISILD